MRRRRHRQLRRGTHAVLITTTSSTPRATGESSCTPTPAAGQFTTPSCGTRRRTLRSIAVTDRLTSIARAKTRWGPAVMSDNNVATVDFTNGSTGRRPQCKRQAAVYVGPLDAYTGYLLSPTSRVGIGAASDGLNDGARIAAPIPPPPPPAPSPAPGATPRPSAAGPPAADLVASFGFDEGSAPTPRQLRSSQQRDHSPRAVDTPRQARPRARVNGRDDFVEVRASKSLRLSRRMTIEAWVRPSARAGGWRTVVVRKGPRGRAYGRRMDLSSAVRPPRGCDSGRHSREFKGHRDLRLGRWSYLTVTYSGSMVRLYVNGVLQSARRARHPEFGPRPPPGRRRRTVGQGAGQPSRAQSTTSACGGSRSRRRRSETR